MDDALVNGAALISGVTTVASAVLVAIAELTERGAAGLGEQAAKAVVAEASSIRVAAGRLGGFAGGLGAAVTLFHVANTMLDPASSSDDHADAIVDGVGAAVSLGASIGEVVGVETVFGAIAAPLAFALPATWFVFKAALRQLADTRVDVAQAMCAPAFEQVELVREVLDARWRVVEVSLARAALATDPEKRAAFTEAARASTGALAAPCDATIAILAGTRSTVVAPMVVGALSAVRAAVGDVPAMAAALEGLGAVLKQILGDARALAAREAGMPEPEAEARLGAPSKEEEV